MNRALIVGASAAGLAAAETLRREGYEGTITLVGDEPYDPYDRPPLSKQVLAGEWPPERVRLRTSEELGGVELRLGTPATALDTINRVVLLRDGTTLPYDGLVIATGVRPRRLASASADTGTGTGTGTPHVLRTLDDALRLQARLTRGRRLIVVGAGFLGAEVAAVARKLGVEVIMLEPAAVPLAHAVGEDVGRVLTEAHREHGVDLRCGVSVTETREGGVRLADGTEIEADDVLVAIGSVPNTEWLAGSGLTLDSGVVCDEYCAAAPGVYAAGDVARWHNPLFGTPMRIEHRTNAAEQGMAAARNLLSPDAPKPFAPVPYFWSDQYDMKVQAFGHLREHDEVAVADGSLADRRFIAAYRKGNRLVGALGVGMPPKAIRQWRQSIAVSAGWDDAVRPSSA
ncbi:FAD-dependent oxidoreductase [Streptomyces sp. NPDC004539]|uniref:NAD(P)/FAD-dependent oxidoreductase n=1 Tax=Streptomyces sp. NPDC004539 TaxID=3154280 RepID=UPI0033AE11D4